MDMQKQILESIKEKDETPAKETNDKHLLNRIADTLSDINYYDMTQSERGICDMLAKNGYLVKEGEVYVKAKPL